MPHQCTKCSRIIPVGSKELLNGCKDCKSHFFFYIKDESIAKLKEKVIKIPEKDRPTIEKDIREIIGVTDKDTPVILDIESIRIIGPGKYEIDVVNLFNKEKLLIYKLEEGKYMIDLDSKKNSFRKIE
jgi:predicted  nucleic acid-binding Zn-ribbon protein